MALKRPRSCVAKTSEESLFKYIRSDAGPPASAFAVPSTINIVPVPVTPHAYITGTGHYGQSFRIPVRPTRDGFKIGRSIAGLGIDLRDYSGSRNISHVHCTIFKAHANDRLRVDNLSRNGTRVNGKCMGRGGTHEAHQLEDKDVISVGDIDMVFTYVNPPVHGD